MQERKVQEYIRFDTRPELQDLAAYISRIKEQINYLKNEGRDKGPESLEMEKVLILQRQLGKIDSRIETYNKLSAIYSYEELKHATMLVLNTFYDLLHLSKDDQLILNRQRKPSFLSFFKYESSPPDTILENPLETAMDWSLLMKPQNKSKEFMQYLFYVCANYQRITDTMQLYAEFCQSMLKLFNRLIGCMSALKDNPDSELNFKFIAVEPDLEQIDGKTKYIHISEDKALVRCFYVQDDGAVERIQLNDYLAKNDIEKIANSTSELDLMYKVLILNIIGEIRLKAQPSKVEVVGLTMK